MAKSILILLHQSLPRLWSNFLIPEPMLMLMLRFRTWGSGDNRTVQACIKETTVTFSDQKQNSTSEYRISYIVYSYFWSPFLHHFKHPFFFQTPSVQAYKHLHYPRGPQTDLTEETFPFRLFLIFFFNPTFPIFLFTPETQLEFPTHLAQTPT